MEGTGITVSTIFRSRRVAPVTAVTLGVLTLGLAVANVPLDHLAHQGNVIGEVIGIGLVGTGAAMGTVVAARRPRNPIGWILLTIFLLVAPPYGQYAVLDYRMHHGSLPLGPATVALLADWPVWLVLITILLWLFPDGWLPPGRWRRVAVILVITGMLLALAATAGTVIAAAGHTIPVDGNGNLIARSAEAWQVVQHVLVIGLIGSFAAWLAVQIPRYRRSAGERRQQLKWLYSGAIVFVISVIIGPSAPGNSALSHAVYNLGTLAAASLPACIGVAVLKYRLYEIDRIISRVISYAIITAVLAGVFAGLVVLATHVLPFTSPVAVAASTLSAAALFNPLRQRVQRTVDRRFNRARYDADKAVAAFAARLQDALDLDTVQANLIDAIHQALEPAHASVWTMQRD